MTSRGSLIGLLAASILLVVPVTDAQALNISISATSGPEGSTVSASVRGSNRGARCSLTVRKDEFRAKPYLRRKFRRQISLNLSADGEPGTRVVGVKCGRTKTFAEVMVTGPTEQEPPDEDQNVDAEELPDDPVEGEIPPEEDPWSEEDFPPVEEELDEPETPSAESQSPEPTPEPTAQTSPKPPSKQKSEPAKPKPKPAPHPKPTASNLIVVIYGGGHVGVAFDVSWKEGHAPVTCHFFRDGKEVFTAYCGNRSSKQFYGVPRGKHSFYATVSDKHGVYSDRSNTVVKNTT